MLLYALELGKTVTIKLIINKLLIKINKINVNCIHTQIYIYIY